MKTVESSTSTSTPISNDDDKENMAIDKNIMTSASKIKSAGKKVSPEVDIEDGTNNSRKRSSEKKKNIKQSPEKDESIERLSSNSLSPIDFHRSQLEKVDQDFTKTEKKRRMSYSGNDRPSTNLNIEKTADADGMFDFLSYGGNIQQNEATTQKSNSSKRRSSMSSIPTSSRDNRMSLSPSRRPLRLRATSIDYKETSLKQKMRSSFYLKTDK